MSDRISDGGPALSERLYQEPRTDAPAGWTDTLRQQKQTHVSIQTKGPTEEDMRVSRTQQLVHRLNGERAAILNYMWQKAAAEDWHAVADAAMDLREIDAKLGVLRA